MARTSQTRKGQSSRRLWSRQELTALKTLVRQNTPTRVIGLKLNRTESSVRGKAQAEGISLKPTNRSPYG